MGIELKSKVTVELLNACLPLAGLIAVPLTVTDAMPLEGVPEVEINTRYGPQRTPNLELSAVTVSGR